MTVARIFRPSKTAMQSGRNKIRYWLLTFEPAAPKIPDPLMGWTGSTDTRQQVRLKFDTCEDAVAFAEKRGIQYVIEMPHAPVRRPKSYAENFRN